MVEWWNNGMMGCGMDRKRIAMFTCLPPTPSGISKYSLDLVMNLRNDFRIDVFVESKEKQNYENVFSHLDFSILNAQIPYDAIIYQLGNNELHYFQYPYMACFKGIIVFHDVILSHSRAKYFIENKLWEDYFEEMRYCHGENGLKIAKILYSYPIPEEIQFLFSMDQKLIEQSLAIGVHDKYHYEFFKYQYPGKRIYHIPMGISDVPEHIIKQPKEDLKLELSLPKDCYLIASFGFLSKHKGLKSILKALKHLINKYNLKFVWIGEDKENLFNDLVKSEGLENYCLLTNYVEEEKMLKYIRAMDVIINLRYPTAGEFPHSLLTGFKLGKATVSSDLPQIYDIPDTITVKIRLDKEVESLIEAISFLLSNEEKRKELGKLAQLYVAEKHSIKSMIDAYKFMILDCCS